MKFGELKSWQKKRLLFSFLTYVIVIVVFLAYASVTMYTDKKAEDDYWVSMLQTPKDIEERAAQFDQNATRVQVGTYVENLKEVNLKTSSFRMVVLIWFKWEGNDNLNMAKHFRIYKGTINKTEVVKNYHENGVNYQAVRCDVSITKNYWNRRFPLESHQLRMYVESELPVDDVVFVNDRENSGINDSLMKPGQPWSNTTITTVIRKYRVASSIQSILPRWSSTVTVWACMSNALSPWSEPLPGCLSPCLSVPITVSTRLA